MNRGQWPAVREEWNGGLMTIALESMAVVMPEVEGHPNRAGFRGVLTVVDVASQKAPSGSKGHRVLLSKRAAEAGLPSLLGMALDYAPTFDRHDVRRKVGVITSAEIVGRNLEVGGFLYARDFPEIVEEIAKSGCVTGKGTSSVRKSALVAQRRCEGARLRASLAAAVERIRGLTRSIRGGDKGPSLHADSSGDISASSLPSSSLSSGALGMSYEVTDVKLADARSQVWILTHVTFTGAAILRRDKAAYRDTWIEMDKC